MLARQREGIAKAKAEGKYKGRQPTARRQLAEVERLLAEGIGKAEIAWRLGIARASVYNMAVRPMLTDKNFTAHLDALSVRALSLPWGPPPFTPREEREREQKRGAFAFRGPPFKGPSWWWNNYRRILAQTCTSDPQAARARRRARVGVSGLKKTPCSETPGPGYSRNLSIVIGEA